MTKGYVRNLTTTLCSLVHRLEVETSKFVLETFEVGQKFNVLLERLLRFRNIVFDALLLLTKHVNELSGR